MFYDKWQKDKNEWRINPPSLLPLHIYSNVRSIFVFKRLQTFSFPNLVLAFTVVPTVSERTHNKCRYVCSSISLQFYFMLTTNILFFSCRLIWLSPWETKINYMRQDWPIFCSYLDRLIQRYSSVSNYQHTARDKIRWLRIVCTFC